MLVQNGVCGSRSSTRHDGGTVVRAVQLVPCSSVLYDHASLSMWVPVRLYERRTLQAIMELVRSQGVTAISAPWSRCSSEERQLSQPKEAYRIDRFKGKGAGRRMRTMCIRTISKTFEKHMTYLIVASEGRDGQLGERIAWVKLMTRVRQQQPQTSSELEESNGTVPIGGFVTQEDCTAK